MGDVVGDQRLVILLAVKRLNVGGLYLRPLQISLPHPPSQNMAASANFPAVRKVELRHPNLSLVQHIRINGVAINIVLTSIRPIRH